MSAPDNERTFVPAEIDALEDALEQSPVAQLRLAAGLDDAARARIHATLIHYRAIERHAKAMLLDAEPPRALLADVIAQAHAAVAVAPAATPVREPESTWSRIKSNWLRPIWVVPSLAAAGSAAIALFVVMAPQNKADVVSPAPAAERTVVAQSTPEPAAKSEMPALAEASELRRAAEEEQRGEGLLERKPTELAGDKAATTDARSLDTAVRAETGRRGEPLADPAPPKSKKMPSAGSGAAGPSAAPGGGLPTPTTPPPAPKSVAKPDEARNDDGPSTEPSSQQRLTRADDARRRGDCDAARSDYDVVVGTGTAKQKARARAGLALCFERAGDLVAAKALIEQARRDDTAIDSWLDAQR